MNSRTTSLVLFFAVAMADALTLTKDYTVFEIESAEYNSSRVQLVDNNAYKNKKALSLKQGVQTYDTDDKLPPDITINIKAPAAGLYRFNTFSSVDNATFAKAQKARNKYDSLFVQIQIDDGLKGRRVIFAPWQSQTNAFQRLGLFNLNGNNQQLRIWLPQGVHFDQIIFQKYMPTATPLAAKNYSPKYLPPATHPRLWVNKKDLPDFRKKVLRPEYKDIWNKILSGKKPFPFTPKEGIETTYNDALEINASQKAFIYLITEDKNAGREAVDLISTYLKYVSFGNMLDITREIGRAIYKTSLVYDWCYDIMDSSERQFLRESILKLACEMECGWPPFAQSIINGHGNENQMLKFLLAMSIAIYDDDCREPYNYCAYRILEELVPMRAYDYQSCRHNQGTAYGTVRFEAENYAAIFFKKMLGVNIFDKNFNRLYYYWIYTRKPNGNLFVDGDSWYPWYPTPYIWSYGILTKLCEANSMNPHFAYDFQRTRGSQGDIIEFLAMDEPDIKPQPINDLPLTMSYGPVFGGMVARTGWNYSKFAPDVVAEIVGGGYNAGGHEHADAGAFQIFCRGELVSNLGQYKFYGTPYDYGYTKRSISKSTLRIYDPNEKFNNTNLNDGGSKYTWKHPTTPQEAQDPKFNDGEQTNGKVLYCSFGPSPQRPLFSYFSADLTSAYSKKLKSYVRNFCFLNFANTKHPAVIIILDEVQTSSPNFKQVWQINTFSTPKPTDTGVLIKCDTASTLLDIDMIIPQPGKWKRNILSGFDTLNIDGTKLTAPYHTAESLGHRIEFSPTATSDNTTYLTLLQVCDGAKAPMKYSATQTGYFHVIRIKDRLVALPKGTSPISSSFTLDLPDDRTQLNVLIAGLKPGKWTVSNGNDNCLAEVLPDKCTIFFQGTPGKCTISPAAASTNLPKLPSCKRLEAPSVPFYENSIIFENKCLKDIKVTQVNGKDCIPLLNFLKAAGIQHSATRDMVTIKDGTRTYKLASTGKCTVNGNDIPYNIPQLDANWYIPVQIAAQLSGCGIESDFRYANYSFDKVDTKKLSNICSASSPSNPDTVKLMNMLASDSQKKNIYWDAQGKNVSFDITLLEPTKVRGVAIRWLSGNSRKASFAIETSADGKNFTQAFKGTSSGKSSQLEEYIFDKPQQARYLRFRGFGNTSNDWNSIYTFKILE